MAKVVKCSGKGGLTLVLTCSGTPESLLAVIQDIDTEVSTPVQVIFPLSDNLYTVHASSAILM